MAKSNSKGHPPTSTLAPAAILSKIVPALATILPKIKPGLKQYKVIMDELNKTDTNYCNVSTDASFKKMYNGFYRMRQRPPVYYVEYFELFEVCRAMTGVTFDYILSEIFNRTKRFEASFASKMLASLDPDKAVWDTYVLANLGLKPIPWSSPNRLNDTVALYNGMCHWYDIALTTPEGKKAIAAFNTYYPNSGITDVKKLDLILWQMRQAIPGNNPSLP